MKSLSIVLLMTCILNTSKGTQSHKSTTTARATTATTKATLPVSLACAMGGNKEVATLTVLSDGYELSSGGDNCIEELKTTGHNAPKKYKLKEACMDTILHLKNKGATQYETSADLYDFKVSCQMDAAGTYTANANVLHVNGPSLQTIAATSHPSDRIELHILRTLPTSPGFNGQLKTDIQGAAYLGERLYLTIVGNYKDAVLIPTKCTAKTSSDSERIFWKLVTTNDKKCSLETDIVETTFKSMNTTSLYPYSYMTIQTFKFADHENEDITFSCTVKVCSQFCSKDKNTLDECDKSSRRRRREIDDSATSKSTIHYVTAKLRVANDVMVHATDGSPNIAYTVPCLLVSLLATAIL